MVRLRDAQQALIADLPPGYLKRVHWLRASACLVAAAETGKPRDIEWAFEAIAAALVEEGWLPQSVFRAPPPRSMVSSNLRVRNVAPRLPAEPPRRIQPPGTDRHAAEVLQQASLKPAPKDLEQFVREYLLFL